MINSAQFKLIAQSMPIQQSVEYILADHLGSASITTSADGDKTSEVHYTPWGEVLDSWSASASLPMEYTFTGQMSYMDDPITSETKEGFGLMFYNARWMDPQLGRFTSADSIVPGGVQGLDRYAYANNSPLRYIDPSGHESVCVGANVDPECNGGHDNWAPPSGVTFWRVNVGLRFGITLSDDGGKSWSETNARLAYDSLAIMNEALNGKLKSMAGGAIFRIGKYVPDSECPECTYSGWTSGTTATFYTMGNAAIRQMNIYHEFGHILDNSPGYKNVFSSALRNLENPSFIRADGYLDSVNALISGSVYDPNYGTAEAIQHPFSFLEDPIIASQEQWADIFANYVAGNIKTRSPFGPGTAMNVFVTDMLTRIP